MPIVNRVAGMHEEMKALRRDIHRHPELLYEVHRTAGVVADKLTAFGCDEVTPGIGRTGVVAVIRGRSPSEKVIGLRADMDALPIMEATGLAWASETPGRMHACGHDGHTTMLLGAAKYLCETRNFSGTAVLIFQPAEEGGAGAKAMIEDGLMERWGIQEVYGMHNQPGLSVGQFAIRAGPLMAASDRLYFQIEGKGGHAAKPHQSIDTVVVGAHLVTALQTVVARSLDPLEAGVVSVCMFHAGSAGNVIPHRAELTGTARSLVPHVRDLLERRIKEISEATALMFGARITAVYNRDYPVLRNHERQTVFAAQVAADVVGGEKVDADTVPVMGGEDFSFMLEARPGAFIFVGNGNSAGLHHPAYDFNDEAAPVGASYWARLVETAMPA